jgi:Domain of unknown function DUF29
MSDRRTGAASAERPKTRKPATSYDEDAILWSEQQARLMRAGRFAELDIEHLADEIEDVGKVRNGSSRVEWPCCWLIF